MNAVVVGCVWFGWGLEASSGCSRGGGGRRKEEEERTFLFSVGSVCSPLSSLELHTPDITALLRGASPSY